MARTPLFADLRRALRIARFSDQHGISTREGLERVAAIEHAGSRRRDFLLGVGAVAATATVGSRLAGCSSPDPIGSSRLAASSAGGPRIAIVGAGIAGLVCADRLQKQGLFATIYEANPTRVGGRCFSNRNFPGHVGENGGEMIDTGGKVMISYAQEFGLALEDYTKQPGHTAFYFAGRNYSEADVVDQWRLLVESARDDVRRLSGAPTALAHNDADVELDRLDLQTWLDTRARDLPLIGAMLKAAYISEYGREPSEQSSLNLLTFIHMDRRSKFRPYGSSDERYHVVGGNDQIPTRIRDRLARPVEMGRTLSALARNEAGEYLLTFRELGAPVVADLVVLAIPFSVLRRVALDTSLGLPPEKVNAIFNLGYGYNGKTEVLFEGRPWAAHGSSGSAYADLPNLQNTWETNWTGGDGSSTLLTDYFGGTLGYQRQTLHDPGVPTGSYCGSCHGSGAAFLPPRRDVIDTQAAAFLADLDRVYPGAAAKVVRNADGTPVLHRAHWLPQSNSRGSYTCYLPGQFTTIAGHEGTPVGNLLFAGEHADSFYEWQGYLEGAARSGVAAATEIVGNHAGGNK